MFSLSPWLLPVKHLGSTSISRLLLASLKRATLLAPLAPQADFNFYLTFGLVPILSSVAQPSPWSSSPIARSLATPIWQRLGVSL